MQIMVRTVHNSEIKNNREQSYFIYYYAMIACVLVD